MAVTLWMVLAAFGGGRATLRLLRVDRLFDPLERVAVSFAVGAGLIGWLAFLPGIAGRFDAPALAAVLVATTFGNACWKRGDFAGLAWPAEDGQALSRAFGAALILGFVAIAAFDVMEAWAPMADADTLAYHYQRPRQFLDAGGFFAIPRAIDGAPPLLLHMTLAVALALGGEFAANLWSMVMTWMLGFAFLAIARPWVGWRNALVGALILLTTPAVVYAGGTGQVETKNALFVLLGAYVVARAITDGNRGMAILAGLLIGFFVGTKLTGILAAISAGAVLLVGSRRITLSTLFSLAVVAAGCQWYAFNYHVTGDPLFPMLWHYLELKPAFKWGPEEQAVLDLAWADERTVPRDFLWFLMYPFRTIFAPLPEFESLRTGIGPAAMLTLPAMIAAAATRRSSPAAKLVAWMLAIACVDYALWFFAGPSLRVRHLVPIYPIVLMAGLSASVWAVRRCPSLRWPTIAGAVLLCSLQLAGMGLFSLKFMSVPTGDAGRRAFLERNISGYDVVEWLNGHLTGTDRVLVGYREWLYLLKVPYFFGHPTAQGEIFLQPGNTDYARFIRQAGAKGITHIVLAKVAAPSALDLFVQRLQADGCAASVATIPSHMIASRSLPDLANATVVFDVYRLDLKNCRPVKP